MASLQNDNLKNCRLTNFYVDEFASIKCQVEKYQVDQMARRKNLSG
jgi:hypothetical protein